MLDKQKLDRIREQHGRLRDAYRGAALRMRDTATLAEQFRSDALRSLSSAPAKNAKACSLLKLCASDLAAITPADIQEACVDAGHAADLAAQIEAIVSAERLAARQRADTDSLAAALKNSREFLDRAEEFAQRHKR